MVEGLGLRNTEHTKGITVKGLALKRAFDQGARETAADARQGRTIEVAAAAASFCDHSQAGALGSPCGLEGSPGQPTGIEKTSQNDKAADLVATRETSDGVVNCFIRDEIGL